jgi:hypothetical protein
MSSCSSGKKAEVDDADLPSALYELRDTLVDLSLTMSDFLFEVDSVKREEAAQAFQSLFRRDEP